MLSGSTCRYCAAMPMLLAAWRRLWRMLLRRWRCRSRSRWAGGLLLIVGCSAEGQAIQSAFPQCTLWLLAWAAIHRLRCPAPILPLQIAVQSFGVVAEALRSLAAVSEAVELDVNQVGPGLFWGVSAVACTLCCMPESRLVGMRNLGVHWISARLVLHDTRRSRCSRGGGQTSRLPTPTPHACCPACTWPGRR